MSKPIKFILFILFILFIPVQSVSAARSKNRSIDVYLRNINLGIEDYLIDILVKGKTTSITVTDERESLLASYSEDGFVSAKYHYNETTKSLTQLQKRRHHHRFEGDYPKEFKIIIIGPNKEITVTDSLSSDAYNSVVYYNYENNSIKEQLYTINIFSFIIVSFLFILTTKFLSFYLFRFNLQNNFKVLLLINIFTVGILSPLISMANYMDGYIFAFKSLLLLGSLTFIIETILIISLIREGKLLKRLTYSVVANLITILILGVFITITIL